MTPDVSERFVRFAVLMIRTAMSAAPLTARKLGRPRRRVKPGITSALERRQLIDVTELYTTEREHVCRDARGQAKKMLKGAATVTDEIVEEAYNTAWMQMFKRVEGGEEIADARAWLVVTTSRRIVDATRKEHEDRRETDVDADELLDGLAASVGDYSDAIASEEAARDMLRTLSERLTEREMQLVRLLILDDLTQPEAAELLGIKPKRVNKLVNEDILPALRKVGADMLISEADVRLGEWCTSTEGRSALTAFACGLLDPLGERHAVVSGHVAHCSRCRAALAAKKAAAGVIPPIFIPVSAGTSGETMEQLGRMFDSARDSNAAEVIIGTAAGASLVAAGGLGGGAAAGGSMGGALLAKLAIGAAAVAAGGGAGVATLESNSPAPHTIRPAAADHLQVTAASGSVAAKSQVSIQRAKQRAQTRARREAARRKAAAAERAAERKAADQQAGTASQDFQPTIASQQQDATRENELSIERPAQPATNSSGAASGGGSEFGIE